MEQPSRGESLARTAFSAGWSAGNFGEAYETRSLTEEWISRWLEEWEEYRLDSGVLGDTEKLAFRCGALLGFFGSCEDHEIDSEWIDSVLEARQLSSAEATGWGEGIEY
jgi:hypothetical protein